MCSSGDVIHTSCGKISSHTLTLSYVIFIFPVCSTYALFLCDFNSVHTLLFAFAFYDYILELKEILGPWSLPL